MHVQRIVGAGIDTRVLVASGQLKLAFQQAAGVGELCVNCIIGGIFRNELYGYLRAGTAAAPSA